MMVRDVEGEAEVPVATSNNEVTVTRRPVPPSQRRVAHKTRGVHAQGRRQTQYYKTVQSVVVTPEKSVRLKTTDGDVIE